MANGLSDILSAYRQGLSSERQSRQAEMQFALQALQFESEKNLQERRFDLTEQQFAEGKKKSAFDRQFQRQGRQRQDALLALQSSDKVINESLQENASIIQSNLYNLWPIMIADKDEETGGFKNSNQVIENLMKKNDKKDRPGYGFTKPQATEIANIVQITLQSAKNPNLASSAQEQAINFGRKVAREIENVHLYPNSKLIKSLQKSGLVYIDKENLNELQEEITNSPYLNITDALDIKENIQLEKSEIGFGDYNIDRSLTPSDMRTLKELKKAEEIQELKKAQDKKEEQRNLEELAEDFQNSQNLLNEEKDNGIGVDLREITDGTKVSDEEILKSLDFLSTPEKNEVTAELDSLNTLIKNESIKLEDLQKGKIEGEQEVIKYNTEMDDLKKSLKYYQRKRKTEKINEITNQMATLKESQPMNIVRKTERDIENLSNKIKQLKEDRINIGDTDSIILKKK